MTSIDVVCQAEAREQEARDCAKALGLSEIIANSAAKPAVVFSEAEVAFYLGNSKTKIYCDFATGKLGYRLRPDRIRQELIVKAVGSHESVIDTTAGLGRDGMMLAQAGFNVTMIERHPVLFALLADGLRRAAETPQLAAATSRIKLLLADSSMALTELQADVVYLDPMYNAAGSSMSPVKKDAAMLRLLTHDSDDSGDQLLELALRAARRRCVVKRPARGITLGGDHLATSPDYSVRGKSVRFDVYNCLNHREFSDD